MQTLGPRKAKVIHIDAEEQYVFAHLHTRKFEGNRPTSTPHISASEDAARPLLAFRLANTGDDTSLVLVVGSIALRPRTGLALEVQCMPTTNGQVLLPQLSCQSMAA